MIKRNGHEGWGRAYLRTSDFPKGFYVIWFVTLFHGYWLKIHLKSASLNPPIKILKNIFVDKRRFKFNFIYIYLNSTGFNNVQIQSSSGSERRTFINGSSFKHNKQNVYVEVVVTINRPCHVIKCKGKPSF